MSWLRRLRRRTRREQLATLMVLAGLLGFVLVTYVVVVIAGGALLGRGSADVLLSVVATAAVALAFDPVQSRLEAVASRVVHGGLASPYDVLRSFSETVAGRYAAEELPVRMARVLAEGTGAAWSQVWLIVAGRPALAATWPPDASRAGAETGEDPRRTEAPGRRAQAVRHGEELLGVLVVQEQEQVPLTSVEERLFSGLAAQAGLVLRGVRLRAELERRASELTSRAGELRLSRQRVVDAQDGQRRLLERDIHDGAQQHLVALAVNLRLAQTLASRSPERADTLLADQQVSAEDAVETLVRLSRGIYPTRLTDDGLKAALRAVAVSSPVRVEVTAEGLGRYDAPLEAAAYFCCLEALQNAAKHAGATSVGIDLHQEGDALVLTVSDNGGGFDPGRASMGTGLVNMRDRIESLEGTLTVDSTSRGTCVRASLPAVAGA